ELGVRTFRDLLYLYPYRYIDRTRIFKINEVTPDLLTFIQIKGRVRTMSETGVGRSRRLNVIIADETGIAEMVWFRGVDFVKRRIEIDREYIFFGKSSFYNGILNIAHPEFDIPLFESDLNRPKVYGVYPSTEKLNKAGCGAKFTSRLVLEVWNKLSSLITETLPQSVCRKYSLMNLREALHNIHFPQDDTSLHHAQRRLKFEEFFMIQMSLLRQRTIRVTKNKGLVFPVLGDRFNTFYYKHLPFELTKAQQKVIKEIRRDTLSGIQMNRLLQGDVGSGKTIVAFITMLFAVDNGFQAAIMAPTEILAQQHYIYISKFAEALHLRVALLTGSTTKKERIKLLEDLASGEIHIIIGTHA
ncbi:MAG: DEAD/DEAH box helicase, partial [Rikenellaceae bacterium]